MHRENSPDKLPLPPLTPTNAAIDWFNETLRRIASHRRRGHLPDTPVIDEMETAILAAILETKRWQRRNG